MDPIQISSFSKLLKCNGDKILNSEFKLTLSGPLLRALNDSFTLITDHTDIPFTQTFQVVKPNNSKSEVFRDLQLIFDFVQKTSLLYITKFPGDEYFEGKIDISKFRNLCQLEVEKVDIKQVVGIQKLRPQIQNLICIRSISCVDDVIIHCGGDKCNGFMWNELCNANFSYNNLKRIDSSLEFAQNIQHLNLSHNHITSVEAIKWLPNLKVLNLSFNRLTYIPMFHIEAPRRLQVLILCNNFIEDLSGLSRLDALNELDLSNNCLLDHSILYYLKNLFSLRYLNLNGNPLYCHPNHRKITAKYLNKNIASLNFILDGHSLSKSEKSLVGSARSQFPYVDSRAQLFSTSSAQLTPQRPSPSPSCGSFTSVHLENVEENIMTNSRNGEQKKVKVRQIEFGDTKVISAVANSEVSSNDFIEGTTKNITAVEGNKEHLDTKKQIEILRKEFGVNWLQRKNARQVKSVLGIQESPENDKIQTITSEDILNELISQTKSDAVEVPNDQTNLSTDADSTMVTSTPVNQTINFDFIVESPIQQVTSESAYESGNNTSASEQTKTTYKSLLESESDRTLDTLYLTTTDEPTISDPEENEVTYIVYAEEQRDELILIISDTSIREKDAINLRTITKWGLQVLESCDRIKSDTLRINFDTVRKDKKERIYTVREGLCGELEKFLRNKLSTRSLFEMNQTLYHCVKCSAEFSRENTNTRKKLDILCPYCKSSFIFEINESKNPSATLEATGKNVEQPSIAEVIYTTVVESVSVSPAKEAISASITANTITPNRSSGEKLNLIEKSSSHGSIGSAGSLNESSSCSKISRSESSFDSNQSVAGSSTQDRDADFSFSKNGESDIEILSNPSQSSIEVLEHAHSSRKTSEERRILHIPSLETIEDNSYGSGYRLPLTSKHTSTEREVKIEVIPVAEVTSIIATGNTADVPATTSEKIERKHHPPFVNLTESSSSGSVTDSICTAYEQVNTDSPILFDSKACNIGPTTNSPTKATLSTTPTSTSRIDSLKSSSKNEPSLITSMLGLFQSTNMLLSRTQKSNQLENLTQIERFKYSYNDFSDADHRIKLFLYQRIFDDSDEHFNWLVRAKLIDHTKGILIEAVVVMSTVKFYILEKTKVESNDIDKWLKLITSATNDRMERVQMLPWKTGLVMTIRSLGQYSILLQDSQRTDNMFSLFKSNQLPSGCIFESEPSPNLISKITKLCESEPTFFTILNSCEISPLEDYQNEISLPGLIITESNFYVVSSCIEWFTENSPTSIKIVRTQPMSNLIEIDRRTPNALLLNFLEDTRNRYELWRCTFEANDSIETCFKIISESWEILFGVPLDTIDKKTDEIN